ncbi:BRD4-interacting chromatin-remodeling complex-associated protein isoform X1 [Orcinus orca]|uniref:BRD4-interacting chromatin-remodeling complex-associated protein isoform X1 n=1 Tax=Orcinus orca TaxID=9733 RepID=UPI0002BD0FB9|nr:BRD4-interacting chromatin-remodeling complex-associated protein isoform X1 [Orcinus orca]XP_033286500.1 BRD4-interacting chromatin-remodeling complex-associated protein isoform X1 [Orcinus orca]XP_033286501.1 BRD4-interacting chromatin-remodeling complex-associated protein isoform X1 [Orcinus orca]XP_033286502.1 BRD4-interacting chromatin-remodeling complex-associated protein isoform X1 [Orcinus orca]XP_049559609.1 BRD4-interacting chromatin-remodeling complex-associated protein isoform X1 
MDDEDGRCLLDVICDPQALNDFLHGSEKLDSDDLLDNPGEAQSAFYEGPGLHVQEASGNHLNPEPSQPAPSVDLDFLEDDILGSPAAGGGGGGGADQPCDILQQSLQEANITEQTLEAEAELDLGPFQLPTLQPADGGAGPAGTGGAAAVATGPQALFPGGADLLGLQAPPTVLTHQALVPPQDVVSKALSVQPFLQPVGLGNVTLQPIPGLQGLPNGSPGGAAAATLGLAPIQVVGQPVMALNPPTSQLLAKQVPVSGYLASAAGPSEPVTLASAGVSPQGAGLVIQKNLPAAVATTLNGNSVFGGAGAATAAASGAPSGQPLAVAPGLGTSPLVPAPNVILHRTPTPIQPKPAGVLPPKLYQLTPKPFAPAGATLTIQGEAGGLPQQPKAPQNLTFMAAGKAGQNVVLSGFPAPALQANVFKQPPATTTGGAPPQTPGALSKPMSVHLLNQGSSIVIPAQHMLPGQNQFLLPGTSAVQLPQPLSALPANVGGQILAAAAPHAGGQLIANPILTNQNLAGPLSLGPVLAPHSGAHSAAHILSAAPIQVGQPALFQMPVSLAAGSLPTQSQPAPTGPAATTVLQGVTLPPSAVAMLNAPDGLVQPATPAAAAAGEAAPVLTVQTAPQASPAVSTPLPLGLQQPQAQQQQQPAQGPAPQAAPAQASTPQPSPGLASSPEKMVLGQPPSAAATAILTQDSLQMFLPQERSQQPLSTEGPHLSVPASVIVSAPPPAQDPALTTPVTKGAGLGPQAPDSQASPAPAPQIPAAAPLKGPGPSSSPSLPHQAPLGDSPHLPSPHPPRPPSRPPSRPHSRPPSQPQSLSRPPSEPALHPCPPPQAPPTLPSIFVIQNQLGVPPPASTPAPSAPGPPQPPLRPPSQPLEGPLAPASTSSVVASSSETSSRLPAPTPPDFQLQFPPGQGPHKSPTPPPTLHLVPEPAAPPAPPPRTFQMVATPFPALPQPKALLERFHQVPSGIILQSKAVGAPAAPQTSASLGPLGSPTASGLVSGQAPSGTSTAPSHAPAPAPVATAGLPPLLPAESKAFASNLPTLTVAKAAASGPGKSSGLQYECKLSSLKKPPTLQPSKEACFLEHLHKHQGSVLHPDYKTAFPSFEDALHRLLPYHVYQGALPSPNDYHKVDEEFETVSTQLLKRTQAMLNKYRLLLLEESRRVSPSAEMVMIDRMFIQEEKTTLALDKQLAKEKPDEYVSSSRSLGLPLAASSEGHRLPSHGPSPSSASGAPTQPPLHLPTKLVIRHGGAGGSPSVSWARASSSSLSSSALSSAASSLDADEDGPMPSRNRPPIKTYEARSRIGLKLKIKQEAGLSKVVHNTALDPVHQTPPPPPAALKAAEPPPRPPPPPPATGQMNGTVDHPPPPAAADRKPPAPAPHCPRLPLRKTYRENVEASGGGAAEGAAAGRARGGSPAPLPTKVDEATSGLIRELAAVEDELYQRMLKGAPAEPAAGAGQGSGSREPGWEAPPLPPAKRRKSESPDVDQASFSSDSPQDDTLTEHLQSAIDSILNLQQAPGRTPAPPYPHAAPAAVTPASPTPLHRPEAYPPSSHNGGLGARTLNR